MITVEQVRAFTKGLPRSYEVLVHDRVKFRVGQIVFVAFSRDETVMGFGFPKEERHMLVETEPHKFMLPRDSDMRFNWVLARCEELDEEEMRELVLDAILAGYVEEDLDAVELVRRGLPGDDAARVIAMVDKAEYKRRQAPPGIRISTRAFGRDRRLPITNRYVSRVPDEDQPRRRLRALR